MKNFSLQAKLSSFAGSFTFCFDMKKSATEADQMPSNTYGERTVIFTLEIGMAVEEKKFAKMQNWEALLNEDSCQSQEELVRSSGVTQQAISRSLSNAINAFKPRNKRHATAIRLET